MVCRWIPKWRAYVNGRRANVIKTNLGYKSVIVPPGRMVEVIFAFGDGAGKLLLKGMLATGMCVFFAVIYLLATEWRRTNSSKS